MSKPPSDINQLLMHVKYNFQFLRRLVDLAEDSNVNIAYCSFQTEWFQTDLSTWIVSTVVAAAREKSCTLLIFSNTVTGVNVRWRRICARSDPESLISSEYDLKLLISSGFLIFSESDLDKFVLVAVILTALYTYFWIDFSNNELLDCCNKFSNLNVWADM